MVQLGAILSGFSLFALFTWMPIWRLASAGSAEEIFRYFVVVMMLVFGVFMTTGGRMSFSLMRFAPAFVAGCVVSQGYAWGSNILMGVGAVIFAGFYIYTGE